MKLIFKKNYLINSINISLKAIPSRTTNEINNCIHIRAYEKIYFTTSDQELWIKTEVEGSVIKEGEIAINARLLSDIVKKLPTDEITLEIEKNSAIIYSGTVKFTLPYMNIDGYSDIPNIDNTYKINLSAYTLKEMIRKTIFCTASTENQNPLMSGEYIEIKSNQIKITATDGSKIAINKNLLDKEYSNKSCIVPAKTLSEISKIISGEVEENISIIITDNHILFDLGTTIILSRLLSGKFFNIEKMLSYDYELNINVNRSSLMDAVDRSILLSREVENNPLILRIKEDLNISIKSRIGEMKENIDIKKLNDKNLSIGLNPRFFLETLKAIDEEEINMYFINKIAPIFIRNENSSYIYIIMPVNFIDEEEYGSKN